ncbi:GntR family transcriptional regulator [Sphingomonas sp. Leaf412]|uniref:GntR family transcriptional regulator n=1 Tax=Sphingomonas sp. Leaf412 TaxID=1736370 RepID=UPI0006F7282C|nr:GntR family transcriptional regulator [Sphingomonas sp. Leaf412]KQT33628.1 GntR family transcriptional regulator [Sphingomonas sp. Leaf412]
MSIVIRTLSERVFDIVRDQIVTGKLPEDLPIRQDALANDLGVSKIPLREALARLEQEGLLTSLANRGYFVRGMSAAEVDEIYALRLNIEPEAAAYAATVATDEDRRIALDAFEALDRAANDNLGDVAIRNRDFHTALVRPGGRLLTTQMVERLSILAERYVIAHLKPAGRNARAHVEHKKLIDAWMARDAERLSTLLGEHIRGTLYDLRAQFGATPV